MQARWWCTNYTGKGGSPSRGGISATSYKVVAGRRFCSDFVIINLSRSVYWCIDQLTAVINIGYTSDV